MSKTVKKIADPLELFTNQDEGSPAAAPAAQPAAVAAADAQKAGQVATRGQELKVAAAAAGATRSDNEQDWLGGGKPRARRKDAAKELLGR